MQEHWAKVYAGHILRFGELTKREIQVVSYLFLCRNGHNNRCDPKQKTIAAGTGLAPPHVSTAIAGLERKGWAIEDADGFHLADADAIPEPKKVTKSVTKKRQKVTKLVTNPAENVTNLVTKVTDSVTKSYQFGNKDIRILNRSLTDKNRAPRRRAADAAKKPKTKEPTRIPDPFPLTDDMIDWVKTNLPALRSPAERHAEFVEHFTNRTDKKALAINWILKFRSNMRLRLKWQIRDEGAADWRTVGAAAGSQAPPPAPVVGDCFVCDNERFVVVTNPNARFDFDRERRVPCSACMPEKPDL
jgi:hypothetical protein